MNQLSLGFLCQTDFIMPFLGTKLQRSLGNPWNKHIGMAALKHADQDIIAPILSDVFLASVLGIFMAGR